MANVIANHLGEVRRHHIKSAALRVRMMTFEMHGMTLFQICAGKQRNGDALR